jgi:hypothetical protein
VFDVTSSDYSQASPSSSPSSRQAFVAVHEAYAEYADTVEYYRTKYLKHERFDMLRMNRELNNKVSGFLRAVRSFLDQTEKRLKERHGKDSIQFKDFEAAKHEQYDASFSYRLMDQVRNYTQHVGDAVHSTPVGSRVLPGHPQGEVHYLRVELDRDTFLAWRKLKPAVREEVKQQPEKIELSPHMKSVVVSVHKIHTRILLHSVSELRASERWILDFISPLEPLGGVPAILHMDIASDAQQPPNVFNLKQELIPVDVARFVLGRPSAEPASPPPTP